MYWTQVVIDRLTTVLQVYKNPPKADVFMPEKEIQSKIAQTADVLRDLHSVTDDSELRATHPSETLLETEERVIDSILPLFRDVLRRLPNWSNDMQKLLKSPWFENCAGRLANDIFCGPDGRLVEGIGSGQPIHGRLPGQLEDMLERESMGDDRAPREALPPKVVRHMGRTELAKRWGQRNSSYLRSAGRMD
jgi:hypothetical protein